MPKLKTLTFGGHTGHFTTMFNTLAAGPTCPSKFVWINHQTDTKLRNLLPALHWSRLGCSAPIKNPDGISVRYVASSKGITRGTSGPFWSSDGDPILLVCEEAHRYVPYRGEAQYSVAQDAIRRIAREGRKYGLGLMLVSQRPADVEGTVISQCNSWIVLRLSNSSDQQHVARFLPDSLSGMTALLPSLQRQEALFVGEAAAIPARIKIRTLSKDRLPNSHDISFSGGWASDGLTEAQMTAISQRMQSDGA